MAKHAMLSPSGAHRWLECQPSALLESLEPFQTPSEYAAEGTEAHSLAELKLSYMLGKINADEYAARFDHFLLTSRFYNEEFNEYVNVYVTEVMTIIKQDYANEKVEVYLEDKVEFTDIVPDGSGTSDVLIIGKNFVHCIDLKFGKGVAVSAIDNPQLKLYVLGGLKKYRLKGIFTEARITIIQPRLNDQSTDYISVQDLNKWAETYVKPRAELASQGMGDKVPGDHCKFCKIKGKCDALAAAQLEVAQKEFETVMVEDNILEPQNMTPEMLSRIMTIAPKFIDWFKDVETYAKTSMINQGLKVPGYKVVQGRSGSRFITNPDAVVNLLRINGFAEEDYLAPAQLLGITTLEKNIGKRFFNDLVSDFIIKPNGRPIVVPETDKRLALDKSQYQLLGQEFEDSPIDYEE